MFMLLFIVLIGGAGRANADQLIKRVNDWLLMSTEKERGVDQYCYVVSQPFRTKAYSKPDMRSPRFAVIFIGKDEYTIQVNTSISSDSNTTSITVNGTSRVFEPSFEKNMARTYSSVQDIALINDLMNASGYFTVRSNDVENDTYALDYYSLRGFGKAIQLMTKHCSAANTRN